MNFITTIQRRTLGLKLHRQKLNTRPSLNVDKILDIYKSSVNFYKLLDEEKT